MKCHESRAPRKPIAIKAGNLEVTIYQGKSGVYDLFTVVHYIGGTRRRETFANLANAKERRAREVARALHRCDVSFAVRVSELEYGPSAVDNGSSGSKIRSAWPCVVAIPNRSIVGEAHRIKAASTHGKGQPS